MPDTLTTNSPIISAYRAATPGSAARASQAQDMFPSGITHDSRYIEPYGLYIARAEGPRKWDVDGRCYVDYFGGHGAMLLGHCNPQVMAAVHAQLDRGTHYGACHELEIEWAELVKRLIPSAERVRFTSSGTEATLMAVRLARAFSGKPKIIRFNYHFHGWHDHMTTGHANHFDGTATTGVLDAVAGNVLLCDQNDEAALARLLEQHPGEIAAAIIEPTGANGGRVPIDPEFLQALRRLTAEHGVLLIFDEVVNGFRVSPGGAQEAYGIKPDLTTLAKILAGGLPGGAVTGRKDILDLLRLQGYRGSRQGEDQPPRHVQRQPALGFGRDRHPQARRRDRCLHSRQRLRRCAANPPQRGLRRRARSLGRLRHLLVDRDLHQPGGHCGHPDRVQAARPPGQALQGCEECRPCPQTAAGDDAEWRRFQQSSRRRHLLHPWRG